MKQITITAWLTDSQIAWLEADAKSSKGCTTLEGCAAAQLSIAIRDRIEEDCTRETRQQLLCDAEERNDAEAAAFYRDLLER